MELVLLFGEFVIVYAAILLAELTMAMLRKGGEVHTRE
jgi:hypothetical protein